MLNQYYIQAIQRTEMDLLKALIIISEKAANIARTLRQNESLFDMLVEQKDTTEANPKFNKDFKTLADVLIQEMTKHDIGLQFPDIKQRIEGEESNQLLNKLGQEIEIEIMETQEETAKLLSKILDGDLETANILAAEVHRTVLIEEVDTKIPEFDLEIDLHDLGVWIDPIDGTNEYVKATEDVKNGDFYLKGLKCVTVLIGVYDKNGMPIIGVINQPFYEKTQTNRYQCHWGISYQNDQTCIKTSTIDISKFEETNNICVGSGESKQYLDILNDAGYNLIYPRGAGYKLLTVVLGISDAYLLSKPTTYLWDTCAPQAILRALGGDIVNMEDLVLKKQSPVKYEYKENSQTENRKGIVAYRNENILNKLILTKWTL